MNEIQNAVLRLNEEPCRYWTDQQIHAALTKDAKGFVNFLTDGLHAVAKGDASMAMPPKQIFSDANHEGDFRVMPCVLHWGKRHWKTVKVVGTNLKQQLVSDKITVGKAMVLHPVENFITDIMDACILSSARTGVCAAIGVVALGAARERVMVIGSGRVGFYTALYLCSIGGVSRLYFKDAVPARAMAAVRALAALFPDIQIGLAKNMDVDLLVLATTSVEPICHPSDTTATTVISLGADSDEQRELHGAWREEANLFVESLDSLRYGDLQHWGVSQNEVTELFDLLSHGRAAGRDRSVFVSTGSALFDNLAMGYLLETAHCS